MLPHDADTIRRRVAAMFRPAWSGRGSGAIVIHAKDSIALYEIAAAKWSIRGYCDAIEAWENAEGSGMKAFADLRMDIIEQVARIIFNVDRFIPLPRTRKEVDVLVGWTRLEVGPKPKFPLADFLYEVRQSVDRITTVLYSEVDEAPLYYATKKGRFEAGDLIANGPYLAPEVLETLPEPTKVDLLESGVCLAFGRPIASACHLFRALESLILSYFDLFNDRPSDKSRAWGPYIEVLVAHHVSGRITDALMLIKREYRNPLTHPRDTLTLDQAIHLMPLAASVIDMMARDLIERREKKARTP